MAYQPQLTMSRNYKPKLTYIDSDVIDTVVTPSSATSMLW